MRLPIRLVVVADDLGRTTGVNRAIAAAFEGGIVTSASLMAGGDAFPGAVEIARTHRGLEVGLHVTLCDGRAVLPREDLPGLVGADGRLEASPARAGVRYWRERRRLLPEIGREVAAQFERAERAGIDLAHVDGHHHLHIHPLIFPIVCGEASRRKVRWIRIPRGDPRDGRLTEWALFGALARINGKTAARHGLATLRTVHGLSRTGRIDESYLLDLLPRLKPGISELFVHPDMDTESGRSELAAVTSARVRDRVAELRIRLVSYAGVERSIKSAKLGAPS